MRTIRFKKDCIEWIKTGRKTTTYRKNKKEGIYEIVRGSYYHCEHLGIVVRLTPIAPINKEELISYYWQKEGDFETRWDFLAWLGEEKVTLPDFGWLMKVEYLGERKGEDR